MRSGEPLAGGSSAPPSEVYDVALLDLDGVVYVGPDAVSGVPEALAVAMRPELGHYARALREVRARRAREPA